MGDRARQEAKRTLLNDAKFNSLHNEAQALVYEKSFEEGIIKLRQAQLYVKPNSVNSRKLELSLANVEREIRTILEIEAEWLYEK